MPRFSAATLISIAIPCAALQAMVFDLVGAHGVQCVAIVYGTLFVVWIILVAVLRCAVEGVRPELLVEITSILVKIQFTSFLVLQDYMSSYSLWIA
jgi:hypothetical protein